MKNWTIAIAIATAAAALACDQDPETAAPVEREGSSFSEAAGELAEDVAEDAGEVAGAGADRVRRESQEAADDAKDSIE